MLNAWWIQTIDLKGQHNSAQLNGKGLDVFKIWRYYQMVYSKTNTRPLDFEIQKDDLIPARRPDRDLNN